MKKFAENLLKSKNRLDYFSRRQLRQDWSRRSHRAVTVAAQDMFEPSASARTDLLNSQILPQVFD